MFLKYRHLLYSLASGLLLSLAWYWNLTLLIFFGFVPLLILADDLSSLPASPRARLKLFGYVYLALFVWNIGVTWWVVYASVGGASMAFIFNALFMAMVFMLYIDIRNRLNRWWNVWLLVPIWIAWEHWHTIWDLSWTWLTVGNVFAFNHRWVQWYEWTGTAGGTCWALVLNILVYQAIKTPGLRFNSRPTFRLAAAILLPLICSYLLLWRSHRAETTTRNVPVVVVQPNVDPYNVKFYLDYRSQFLSVLELVKTSVDKNTDYLVLPETFITDDLNEATIGESLPVRWFRDSLIVKFPDLKIITGGNTYVFYDDPAQATATSRLDKHSGKNYDVFNTAILIDAHHTAVYHKSKLVPGVERMPFPALLRPLESLAIDMGGTVGSLGVQKERFVFTDERNNVGVAPVICYESVYADYVTAYVRKGAGLIFIITNDGWWENTPGYVQHLNYARLRAIENRRELARCANTGISCFVNKQGDFSQATAWWREAVIKKDLHSENQLTFFSRFGDLISYLSLLVSLILVLYMLASWLRKKALK